LLDLDLVKSKAQPTSEVRSCPSPSSLMGFALGSRSSTPTLWTSTGTRRTLQGYDMTTLRLPALDIMTAHRNDQSTVINLL